MNRFVNWLKNAFAIGDPNHGFTPEDLELLKKISKWVRKRRLTAAAILFLEGYKPLGFLGSQAMAASEPFVKMAAQAFPGLLGHISEEEYDRFLILLEERSTILKLIEMIQEEENNDRE